MATPDELQTDRSRLLEAIGALEAQRPGSDEELVDAYAKLASVEAALGRGSEARGLLEKALALKASYFDEGHPALAQLRLDLAMIHLQLGEVAAARALAGKAIESYDRFISVAARELNRYPLAEAHARMAVIEQRGEDAAAARRSLEKAIDLAGAETEGAARFYAQQARLEWRSKEWLTAKRLLEKAIVLRSGAASPTLELADDLYQLALWRWGMGDQEAGRDILHRAVKTYESVPQANLKILGSFYRELGTADYGRGRLDEARESLHRAAELLENTPSYAAGVAGALDEVASSLYVLGLVERDSGNPLEARENFRRAIAIWERSPEPGSYMRQCCEELSRSES
jgi:tetratricopeptide (TPR) repeat protein